MDCVQRTTPMQIAAHVSHKARLERIASRSIDRRPLPTPPAPAPMPESAIEQWFDVAPAFQIPTPKYPPVDRITEACAKHFGVTTIDIKSARRTANVVRPRQVAMYLAKNLTLNSLPQIGRRFGGRDHTTVLHAVRKIERLVREDALVAQDVAEIEAEMGGENA